MAVDTILEDALGPDPAQQAVAQKRDLLERLMARLAHEIRNPLSSLGVHVQLLEEDVTSMVPGANRLTDRFQIIRGELHRLESIVGHFLRLAGPSSLELEELELPRILNHVIELLRPEAESRGICVSLLMETPMLPGIEADRVRLTQVFLNLLINAMQAVQKDGNVWIKLAANESNVRVQVTDDGPGIPPEKLAAIFDPYFTTKEEGSGLGLWIAQQIVTGHGGSLRAQNGSEKGAMFTLVLPIRQKSKELAR